eukprot:1971761-Karenia_brevis.AAC.1
MRFKTEDAMKDFLTNMREEKDAGKLVHDDRKISVYADPGPVNSYRTRLLAVAKDCVTGKGVSSERVDFDRDMGVLMIDDVRAACLKGDGMKLKVEVNTVNLEKLQLDFSGPTLQLAIDKALRNE